ncbi:beta-galactosidase [Alkalihalobacillus macyae]|uniref:glycoside hydrolase family 35 protein n=1 Tax=Guptibacillus hwajinpoensis TaxID=208199 RepID=UPI00273BC54E|nr:glycoside hydrolase family 35 protein [Alkalihalobacillus macyae]MDP4552519.1 beta-galactosidase [Alkalihalobacillus macyae]
MLKARGNQFYLNDEPFQILSGGLHYFRVVPEYWKDRLQKLKALGLNTVETYIPWNFHEPKKGQFHFEGMADVERFIAEAQALGLYVILRPSPYICAEWEMGGLPSWLLKEDDMALRCSHPAFLKHVEDYFDELLPRLKPFLLQNGGTVIAFQIENEYGAYGNDQNYLAFHKEQYEKHGIDTFYFTSDGPDFIKQGSMDNVVTTLNFGSRPEEAFAALEEMKPNSPKMVAEFWIGWFDHWSGEHHTRDEKEAAEVFQKLMDMGASVNFYMFHGGTNFGFYNGANHYEKYAPTITSYDYDSLLTEWGDVTKKYLAMADVLKSETNVSKVETESYGEVTLTESASLFEVLKEVGHTVEHITPLSMEKLDQNLGYTLYRTTVNDTGTFELDTTPIRDRAFIYVNGKHEGTVSVNDDRKSVSLHFPNEANTLEILVENLGRVNYGKHLSDQKGIVSNLWLNDQYWFNWEMVSIEGDVLPTTFSAGERYPKYLKGTFQADACCDTFVDLEGFAKGNVYINGFNLGRYWQTMGPQQRLYVPGPLLHEGENELVVLELEGNKSNKVTLTNEPKLG